MHKAKKVANNDPVLVLEAFKSPVSVHGVARNSISASQNQ
jgi:hypothetical protein